MTDMVRIPDKLFDRRDACPTTSVLPYVVMQLYLKPYPRTVPQYQSARSPGLSFGLTGAKSILAVVSLHSSKNHGVLVIFRVGYDKLKFVVGVRHFRCP